jgi:hypothetical protein
MAHMANSINSTKQVPKPSRGYRVEHHHGDTICSLGYLMDTVPHHTSLEPYVSALLRSGLEGKLLLIDESTGAVVATRLVRPFRSKSSDRFRKSRN